MFAFAGYFFWFLLSGCLFDAPRQDDDGDDAVHSRCMLHILQQQLDATDAHGRGASDDVNDDVSRHSRQPVWCETLQSVTGLQSLSVCQSETWPRRCRWRCNRLVSAPDDDGKALLGKAQASSGTLFSINQVFFQWI